MQKMIPYEKLSKKEQRRLNAAKRGSWGEIKPVTRMAENPKAYKRSKVRNQNLKAQALISDSSFICRWSDLRFHSQGSLLPSR